VIATPCTGAKEGKKGGISRHYQCGSMQEKASMTRREKKEKEGGKIESG